MSDPADEAFRRNYGAEIALKSRIPPAAYIVTEQELKSLSRSAAGSSFWGAVAGVSAGACVSCLASLGAIAGDAAGAGELRLGAWFSGGFFVLACVLYGVSWWRRRELIQVIKTEPERRTIVKKLGIATSKEKALGVTAGKTKKLGIATSKEQVPPVTPMKSRPASAKPKASGQSQHERAKRALEQFSSVAERVSQTPGSEKLKRALEQFRTPKDPKDDSD